MKGESIMNHVEPTCSELFDILNALSEYHHDVAPLRSDRKDDLLEKYFYWVDEYNDGYDPHNIKRPNS